MADVGQELGRDTDEGAIAIEAAAELAVEAVASVIEEATRQQVSQDAESAEGRWATVPPEADIGAASSSGQRSEPTGEAPAGAERAAEAGEAAARQEPADLGQGQEGARPAVEPGAEGLAQTVIPGAEQVSTRELLEQKSKGGIKAPQDFRQPAGALFAPQQEQAELPTEPRPAAEVEQPRPRPAPEVVAETEAQKGAPLKLQSTRKGFYVAGSVTPEELRSQPNPRAAGRLLLNRRYDVLKELDPSLPGIPIEA